MRCHSCGSNVPDGYLFCTECGSKLSKPAMQPKSRLTPSFCPECGIKVNGEKMFCEECGYRLSDLDLDFIQPTQDEGWNDINQEGRQPDFIPNGFESEIFSGGNPDQKNLGLSGYYDWETEKSSKKDDNKTQKVLLIIISVLAAVLVLSLGALAVKIFVLDKRNSETAQETEVVTSEAEEQEEPEVRGEVKEGEKDADVIENPSDEEINSATYNLFKSRKASFEGVMAEENGKRGVKLGGSISAYGAGSSGKAVLLKNVVYVEYNTKNANVSKEQIQSVGLGESVTVTGNVSIIDNKLVIFPDSLNGESAASAAPAETPAAPTEAPKPTATPAPTPVPEYVLPNSATSYLTDADIQGLTLQQINYAKNEIYARHGRKFQSPELQKYFGSKSWYSGTIDPSRFSESVFSKVETANIKFLAAKEFAMDPKGYQLDK